MRVTEDQLKAIFKEGDPKKIPLFLEHINQTMEEFEINTPARIRMFLAQIGHESGQLRYTVELASGKAYENRKDLGNTSEGDGPRYKGRGLIQLTGKRNYSLASLALDADLLGNPDLLSQPAMATRVSGWFWSNNNLNSLCDKDDFRKLTKRINGGYNGWEDRVKLYERACAVIKP